MFWKLNLRNNTGAQAENSALSYLKQQGLTLLTRNFASKTGEVDLIMLDKETLVFIEVRFRSNNAFGSASHTLNRQKQSKIRKTAHIYLQSHPQHRHRICRFDLVALDSRDSGKENTLEWIKNAFY